MYLDNGPKLRGPETLSENSTLTILHCVHLLLECADHDSIHPFLELFQTPYEESLLPRFLETPFLPTLRSTPARQFLSSSRAETYFVILLFHLNELVEHPSHQLTLEALRCLELLLLTADAAILLPVLPSVLSTIAVTLRSEALLSWREKTLMVFVFAHALAAVVKPPAPVRARPLGHVVMEWLRKATETPADGSESVSEEESTEEPTRLQSQSQRVRAELPEKVPPLLSLVLRSVASETHLSFRLVVAHAAFLLLPPALAAFPSVVAELLDLLVEGVNDDASPLRAVSRRLAEEALSGMVCEGRVVMEGDRDVCEDNCDVCEDTCDVCEDTCDVDEKNITVDETRDSEENQAMKETRHTNNSTKDTCNTTEVASDVNELLATHVNAVIDALPAAVCVGSEAMALRALRRALGFCQLLAPQLPAVLTVDRLWEERALDLYEQQKQMLAIRDVTTVAVQTRADARPATLFRVNYRHCSEATASLLLRCIETLWRHLPASDELVLTLLADCGRGDCEAAWLAQFLFQAASPALDEFIDASLDALRLALQRPAANTSLLLLSLTRLTLRSGRLQTVLPSLLSLLFYHQSQSETPGPVQAALWIMADALSLPSPAALALQHADYLLDSALLQLRLADALTSSALDAALRMMATLWTELLRADSACVASLLPHARDCVQTCCDLLHKRVVGAVAPLLPLAKLLVRICNGGEGGEEKKAEERDPVSALVERYLVKLRALPSLEPKTPAEVLGGYEFNGDELNTTELGDDEARDNDINDTSETNDNTNDTNDTNNPETQLKAIVRAVQFCLREPGLRVPRAALDVLKAVLQLKTPEDAARLLLPSLPLLAALLRRPQSHLFCDAADVALRIAGCDTRATTAKLMELWPHVREALEGCALAAEGDFEVIGNQTQAQRVETSLLESLCEQYKDEQMLEKCCRDVCAFIDRRWTLRETPPQARRFLWLACRYNLDEVVKYVTSTGSSLHLPVPSRLCSRFHVSESTDPPPTTTVACLVEACLD